MSVKAAVLDVRTFWAALDVCRSHDGLSWRELAREAGVSASTLTRMGQGKRPDVDTFASLVVWSCLDPGRFFFATTKAVRRPGCKS